MSEGGHRPIVLANVAAPLLFAAALTTRSDALAVALLAAVCAVLLGLFSWQRRLRQTRTPAALFPALTSLGLAVECLGVSLAGLALLAQARGRWASGAPSCWRCCWRPRCAADAWFAQ